MQRFLMGQAGGDGPAQLVDACLAQIGEVPAEAINRLAGRIWNVHLEDIQGQKHYHLVPGEGDVDFQALLGALQAVGYNRWVTVELYTCAHRADAAARRAHEVLAPLIPTGG